MAEPVFSDRFSRENPALTPTNVESMKEQDLLDASTQLKFMVQSVRRVDATLSRKSAKEIFYVITGYADPKIGGILAAARDKSTGKRVFKSIDEVKQIMYPQNGSENLDLTVFNDMVRQACVTLTASRLVGNLAPGGDNFQNPAEYLLNSAVADIERITETIDMDKIRQQQQEEGSNSRASFYFEKAQFTLDYPLEVSVFVSGTTASWELVHTFEGEVKTADIVSKVSDYINKLTISGSGSTGSPNLLAAPILAGEEGTHSIVFDTRRYSSAFSSEIVSIKFSRGNLPFKWGTRADDLEPYQINSQIIETKGADSSNDSSTNPLLDDKQGKPTVLYIRKKSGVTPKQQDRFSFRVGPHQEEEELVPFVRYTANDSTLQESYDNQRPSQLALSLINKLHEQKGDVKCLGAILKSDPPDEVTNPTVAVELIGYKVMVKDVWLVLDLIRIPEDLEVAIGDLREPLTSFSNEPRSVRVETNYLEGGQITPSDVEDEHKSAPKVVNRPSSSMLTQVRQKMNDWYELDQYNRRLGNHLPY